MVFRSERDGYFTRIFIRNRSSCASGRGYVPSISIGFCVAITKNGCSSSCVVVPRVTVCSCMASSRADCVLGVARLISSASTRFAKIGPAENRSVFEPVFGIDNHAADNVGRHQIGRELNAGILQMENAGKRSQQSRLSEPRNAFKQHMSARQQTDQHAIDDILLADDDLADFITDLFELSSRAIRLTSSMSIELSPRIARRSTQEGPR